jgi:hypothetical protein
LFNDDASFKELSEEGNRRMIVNGEQLMIWKEVNMSYFKVLSTCSSGETEKRSLRDCNQQYDRNWNMYTALLAAVTGPGNSYINFS